MLTLFSIPKPSQGHIGLIQRNAVESWSRLGGQVILFGEEAGTAALAAAVGAQHVPQVRRNRYGTPLVSDLFEQARQLAEHPVLAYVNADIILMDDFAAAVRTVVRRKKRFLLVGQRWDTPIGQPLDFTDDWQDRLRQFVRQRGSLHRPTGIDYFVFNRDLWGRIPDFAIGRTAWDNWFIYRAVALKAPVIDASADVMAVHQNHDYAHGGGYKNVWRGPEAKLNVELAGGPTHLFTLWDTGHVLTDGRIQPRTHTGLGGGIWNYRRSARFCA